MVAQARIPLTRVVAVGEDGLQVPPAGGILASSLTVTDVGTPGVRVLLIKSLRTDRELRPFGVTGQAELAHYKHIERRAQSSSHYGRHRDATSRQSENERPWPFCIIAQILR